jgi:hypothetical protein
VVRRTAWPHSGSSLEDEGHFFERPLLRCRAKFRAMLLLAAPDVPDPLVFLPACQSLHERHAPTALLARLC